MGAEGLIDLTNRVNGYTPPEDYHEGDPDRLWARQYLYAILTGNTAATALVQAGVNLDGVKYLRRCDPSFQSLERETKDVGAALLAQEMRAEGRLAQKQAVKGGTLTGRRMKPNPDSLVPGWDDDLCHICESSRCRNPEMHDRMRNQRRIQRDYDRQHRRKK